MDVLVFGDQTHEAIAAYIHDLVFVRKNPPLVACFLSSVSRMLRKSIGTLPLLQREKLPGFANLEEFINSYISKGCISPTVETTILCVAQLADYITYVESGNENAARRTAIIAASSGLFAGATASVLPKGMAGVALAVRAVELAFRVSLYVERLADRLEPKTKESNSANWSLYVYGLSATEAQSKIDNLITEQGAFSELKKPYLSAIWPGGLTISGPPSTLHEVRNNWRSTTIESIIPARILVPYHASHLHPDANFGQIIDWEIFRECEPLVSESPKLIFSSLERNHYSALPLPDLYKAIVTDILASCQDFSSLIDNCHREVSLYEDDTRLVALGPVDETNPLFAKLGGLQLGQKIPFFNWKQSSPEMISECGSSKKDGIAIVGMSGRFPGAQDLDEFWKVLYDGLDMHREVPPDRFDAQIYYDPSGKGRNKSHTPYGCFVDHAGLFDPRFFNMSPREATQTDPMQRLSLLTAYEALEMSGYVPNRTPSTQLDRIGTFYGQTSDDWREINEAQDIDTYFITGGVRAFGPGRINYHFGFSGPSFSIDTACSSSMAAIHAACNSLWLGDCDTAIAGGVNIMTNPDIFAGLSKGQFLSKVGPCQTFDNDADGYCRGDAVGSLILKRVSDAEADNDNILGVIMSAATNHSADAISITHPHAGTQEILYRRVLSQAGVDPQEISYVEMHGTGTQAGDDTEMRSVSNIFSPAASPRRKDKKVYVGSVKANVGHGEASSGVTAVIKALLMMRNNLIPPHVGIKREINRGFPDLGARNIHIATQPANFPRVLSEPRKIFVNNFSAAGGNTAIVLQDGTPRSLKGSDPRETHVVAVSARALSSLKANLNSIAEYLSSHPNVALPSLSYTTTARRIQHNYRFSVAATNISAVRDALKKAVQTEILPVPSPPKVVFTFTGQGSMYTGLAADLFQTCTTYRESVLEFDSVATSLGFPSIRNLVDGTEDRPIATIPPVSLQVAQISIQMALTRMWQSFGIRPDVIIGHSLGEYAALFASAILSASDVIYLVGSRAMLLETNCIVGSHAMLAVQGDMSSWQYLVSENHLEIACINSKLEVVLSGRTTNIDAMQSSLQERGIRATRLKVPYAFHSSQIDSILSPFLQICSGVTFNAPGCELLSPLLGRSLDRNVIDGEYLCRHARETVNFYGALETAMSSKIIDEDSVFIEVGPHPICNSFVRSIIGSGVTTCPSLQRNSKSWETFASATSLLSNKGVHINWGEYHRDFEGSLELLELPAYKWALSNYWIDYKNDWCLTKGMVTEVPTTVQGPPPLSTTSVQTLVKEQFTNTYSLVEIETDISRPDLRAVLSGHLVNNVALCPSSLYGDIGISIGEYMYRNMFPELSHEDVPCINVRSMAVPKTLIGKDSEPHPVKIVAEAKDSKECIKFSISSHQGEHASFTVDFGRGSEWMEEWNRTGHLVESRIEALRKQSEEESVHVLRQEMAYKLFSSFVDYSKTFQGIKKVYLNPDAWEATADVVLENPNPDQKFVVPPYWIDSIGHLSGFILNVQTNEDAKKNVFVSHGWESLRLARPLVPGRTYRTYVRMIEKPGSNIVSGDVYCLEKSTVIAVFGGVTFMRIPRAVLDQVLPKPRPGTSRSRIESGHDVQRQHEEQRAVVKISKTDAVQGSSSNPRPPNVLVSQVLTIVAEECGVDQTELADPNSFADLGVDSLMQLAISSRMREELELEVSSSLFIDHPTVRELKLFLRSLEPDDSYENDASDQSSTSPSEASEANDNASSATSDIVITPLSSDGIHPLGTVPVLHDAHAKPDSDLSSAPTVQPLTLPPLMPHRKSTSFLLQGNAKTATTRLFLIPDGGGSAASYTHIPDLSPDIVVYGLNSPFMTTPQEFTCGVTGIARYYIEEIRRRQPIGPYNVGGWSAGGVIAFESSQQLIRAGEKVDRLILIDAPCPLTIEPLPLSLHRWFNTLGLLGDGDPTKIPAWLLPHFQASINALSTYNARTIDPATAPTTYVIWCEHGVCKEPTDPRPDPYPYGHAQFLLENKQDLGPQLWEAMVGMTNIRLAHIPGNHFTMMRAPFARGLGDKMREAFL
ncbi:conidial yellow pigment biosynthesis polyketide synthase [Penicillium macrosclerotiorum]|uniref:conidial yellow pigment biosynthesis polyketide synthase n=1 Tax=Penicillium macrosclerotiorum TaxID=303699 RepID=UPI0025466D2A|nr:conidial yellow pigment biosynthesis polyketide synthase [Penicillium macrosclerotiorum]KAJ5676015.1 conidial yellow pigment biosynthesis polyketide synthase [Penicillium macrosclerotiorum]